jgi:hypothetical protein
VSRQVGTKTQSYANAFYAECAANAKEEVVNGEVVSVWSGFIGETCRKLRIPTGMERKVVKPLEAMGCIKIVQRGAGPYPSMLVLAYPPTEDLWVGSDAPSALTRRPTYASLISDVETIKKQLGGGNIVEALAELDRRLKSLEAQAHKARKVGNGT